MIVILGANSCLRLSGRYYGDTNSEAAPRYEALGSACYTQWCRVHATLRCRVYHSMSGSRPHVHFFCWSTQSLRHLFRSTDENQLVCQSNSITQLSKSTIASMHLISIKSFSRTGLGGGFIHSCLHNGLACKRLVVLQLHCLFYTLVHIGGISDVHTACHCWAF